MSCQNIIIDTYVTDLKKFFGPKEDIFIDETLFLLKGRLTFRRSASETKQMALLSSF